MSKTMRLERRQWLRTVLSGLLTSSAGTSCWAATMAQSQPPLLITGLKATPVALPDPPILAASGCHGPYFLRNVVELITEGGIVGIGETHGGDQVLAALERARKVVVGQNAFAYQRFARELQALGMACQAGIELAALDACGRATGRRLCEMIGGPVRDSVEFAAYLFYRYAADHPVVLADPRVVDPRGRGDRALDDWGEVRSPEAMAKMAARFRDRFGFRVFKLKGGVLAPEVERDSLKAMAAELGPQARAAHRPQRALEGRDRRPNRQGPGSTPNGVLRRPGPGAGKDGRGAARDRTENEHQHVRDQLRSHPQGAEIASD